VAARRHGDITAQAIATSFYRGYGTMCQPNQKAIDLFIPILLHDNENWWEAEGGIPVYDKIDTLLPAKWGDEAITGCYCWGDE
jgi:hypothetical protein